MKFYETFQKENQKHATVMSEPRFAVLESDRRRRRNQRRNDGPSDTARTARMGRPRDCYAKSGARSSAESLTRATVEEMLAERREQRRRREGQANAAVSADRRRGVRDGDDATRRRGARHTISVRPPSPISPPSSRVYRRRVTEEPGSLSSSSTSSSLRQRLSKRDLERTAPLRCEVRGTKTADTPRLACVVLRVVGVRTPDDLRDLVERATTLTRPGLAGLIIDCRLSSELSVLAFTPSPDARTPSKLGVSGRRSSLEPSVHLSVLSSIEDARRLWHGYRKRRNNSHVRMIVCGSVLSFEPIEFLSYNEALAIGTPMASVPKVSTDTESTMRSERGGLLGSEEGKPDSGGAWRSGTAFYRPPPRSHTTATSEAALDDGTLIEDIEVDADNKVVSTEPMEPLDPHIKYQHLSQIERALRMLGNDVVAVQEEFDTRCDRGTKTITVSQAQKAISALLGGVIPGECRTVLDSLGYDHSPEMTFSELCILFAEKFYFHALKMRESGMRREVKGLLVRAGVEADEFDRDNNIEGEEQVTVAHDEASAAEKSAASENVDSVISRSILDEEAEFLRKVNAAFRRFDVYGTSEEEDPFTHRDEETEEAGGLILIEDAPDALVACGLPIEREEAENLVIDLASGTLSSEFQGFTKAEFVLVCKRIQSIFQEAGEDLPPLSPKRKNVRK